MKIQRGTGFNDHTADGFKNIIPHNHTAVLDVGSQKEQIARMKLSSVFDGRAFLQDRNECF